MIGRGGQHSISDLRGTPCPSAPGCRRFPPARPPTLSRGRGRFSGGSVSRPSALIHPGKSGQQSAVSLSWNTALGALEQRYAFIQWVTDPAQTDGFPWERPPAAIWCRGERGWSPFRAAPSGPEAAPTGTRCDFHGHTLSLRGWRFIVVVRVYRYRRKALL